MILGIDTSGKNLGLALCQQGHVIAEILLSLGLRHGEVIQEKIGDLMGGNRLKLKDLTGISLTLGPGSFTGLRIGLAVAKGYCYALKLPLAGVSTLEAVAGICRGRGKIAIAIQAGRGEFYIGYFDCTGASPVHMTPDKVGKPIDVQELAAVADIVVGPSSLLTEPDSPGLGRHFSPIEGLNLAVAAAVIGEINIAQGKTLALGDAVPYYVRSDF